MTEKIEIKELTKTCDSCPAQWEFITNDNRNGYIRYRWGKLTISLGQQGMSVHDVIVSDDCFILWATFGHDMCGQLSTKNIISILSGIGFDLENCEMKNCEDEGEWCI